MILYRRPRQNCAVLKVQFLNCHTVDLEPLGVGRALRERSERRNRERRHERPLLRPRAEARQRLLPVVHREELVIAPD